MIEKYKECSKCFVNRPLSEFYKDKTKSDGHRPDCKSCVNNRVKNYNKNHINKKAEYDKSRRKLLSKELAIMKHEYYLKNKDKIKLKEKERHEKYPWRRVFYGIKDRCENPNDEAYMNYGGRGTKCLLTERQVEYLWFKHKAYNLIRPTIDRKNNNGNYTLENCQFIEHFENTGKDRRKPVMQFDLDGNFIKGYNSVKDANRKTKVNYYIISAVANGISKTGFIWRYKNE